MTRLSILRDISRERDRQEQLRSDGRFKFTLATEQGLTGAEKLACIVEEVGEVARNVLALEGLVQEKAWPYDLREELVQVAALAVAWVEALDSEYPAVAA